MVFDACCTYVCVGRKEGRKKGPSVDRVSGHYVSPTSQVEKGEATQKDAQRAQALVQVWSSVHAEGLHLPARRVRGCRLRRPPASAVHGFFVGHVSTCVFHACSYM